MLAQTLLEYFRGRPDFVALGEGKGFAPFECPEGINPAWLDDRHFANKQALGFYVLTEDSKCWCSCVDFDNKPEAPDPMWKSKAEQVYHALLELQIQPIVELSQSGQGAHVWIFFDTATDAWIPRSFFKMLAQRLQIVLREIYPRQDRHTGKGLGNLVRFPLWNKSRFVDVDNGWAEIPALQALADVSRISGEDLRIVAWQAGLGNLQPPATAYVSDDQGVSPRVRRLVDRSWTLVGTRWLNDGRGMSDSSPSSVAMSIATELVRNYVPTPEVESAIRTWCKTYAPDKATRPDWISHTVNKAYDFVVEKTQHASTGITTLQDCALQFVKVLESGGTRYVPSGISLLDQSIDGVSPGEMCVVAARPGQGKTAFALQWLDHASFNGMPGLIISNEMNAVGLGQRRLSSITRLDFQHWDAHCAGHFKSEIEAYHMNRKPVYVAEACIDIQRVDEMIDQVVQIYGVGIVAIDYLQLCRDQKNAGKRYDEVSEISRRMKQAALRNNVAMLALCQLNRANEHRADREPQMSDLRDSGQIEQDADMILFLQWPCRFDKKAQPWEYRVLVAKRRNGPIREPRIVTTFNAGRQTIGIDA